MTGLRANLELADVEDYLNSRLDRRTRLRSIRQTFPGMSRETWLALAADEHEVGYVVRIDPPSQGSVPMSLRYEWEVYRRLWDSPIPTAEPLWFDEGIEFADGRAHMIRRMVDGSTNVDGVGDQTPDGDATRRAVAMEVAEKLALVHTLDWRQYGLDEVLDVPPDAERTLSHQVASWRSHWEKFKPAPSPVVTEALFWLDDIAPKGPGRISLLKGNNGLGEEIWRDGRIVAMSDWELAELGDPALDWAFSQGVLLLHDEAETLAHYEACTGFPVDPSRLAWARIWILMKVIICSVCAVPSYQERRDPRPNLAALGLMIGRIEQLLGGVLGKDLDEASAIVGRAIG